jgi:tRNA-dihydrouridine synthase
MRYGVSDSECWSLDWTLTNFILPRLKHFKKINVHTHPPDITPEQWDKILDELIWTFEYMHDEEKFNPTPMFRYEVDNMDDYFKNIKREKTPEQKQAWEEYLKKNEELEERRKKGMLLFAEYYQQLWD